MKQPEVIIIGGGLAGLTAAINLANSGLKVRLYEKENFPHHKVCGEYLSREVIPYLNSLGVYLKQEGAINISRLLFTDQYGNATNTNLPLGGLGISRFILDDVLYKRALEVGVQVVTERVIAVNFHKDQFTVSTGDTSATTELVLGAYGKRSLLDKNLNRDFISRNSSWLAVKGHYKNDLFPVDTVALHNFEGGYCGLSKTENGAVNVCYLATYKSFKKYKNPEDFKTEVLCKNPHLAHFFKNASPIFSRDLTIAQISFEKKSRVEDHIIMLGDAAGLIHPLCGNGMAMAIHSAKLVSESILKNYNSGKFDRKAIERAYLKQWDQNLRSRLRTGHILQQVLLNTHMSRLSQNIIKLFPSLLPFIIKNTHGKPLL
ncbi:NAD(P)/FAD-dependent oxidoreductase [soil metagenome]